MDINLDFSNDIAKISNRPFVKFTSIMQGGFDGTNIFNKEKSRENSCFSCILFTVACKELKKFLREKNAKPLAIDYKDFKAQLKNALNQ
jgi:hypothetical protein